MLHIRAVTATPTGDVHRLDTTGDAARLRDRGAEFARSRTEPISVLDVTGLRGARLVALVEGLALGGHRFSMASAPAPAPKAVELLGLLDESALASALSRAAATNWARELANTPASTKSPAWLADRAADELSPVGVGVTIRDERWLADNGFGGVLAVGGGSSSPPCLVEAAWHPRGARPGVHAVIVGKGITFDSGGLNIKPAASMRGMHTDMSGAAAAFAALRSVAQAELPVRVTVLVPAAENSVSGAAFRPGDVVRHYGGRTSEIANTDAEGRLVLADALAYAAARLRPTVLVDIATLTGAMKIALGLRTGGLFATTDGLARAFARAADVVGEPLWRLPLAEDYAQALGSHIGDANNAPGNPGAITAALFLRPFTGGLPWAHLDIAGPARAAEDNGWVSRGATGFGARLLARWVESLV